MIRIKKYYFTRVKTIVLKRWEKKPLKQFKLPPQFQR